MENKPAEAWIELDYQVGRCRYTYWGSPGSEQTLIRWDYINEPDWIRLKNKFFSHYPGVPVRTRSGKDVDTKYDIAEEQ